MIYGVRPIKIDSTYMRTLQSPETVILITIIFYYIIKIYIYIYSFIYIYIYI